MAPKWEYWRLRAANFTKVNVIPCELKIVRFAWEAEEEETDDDYSSYAPLLTRLHKQGESHTTTQVSPIVKYT